MSKKTTNWDSEENEVSSNWIKWNVPLEDKVIGTLIRKFQHASTMKGKEGKMEWAYDIKVDEGTFHALDEKKKLIDDPIVCEPGSFWTIGKESIDTAMKNVKIGQKVGFKFIEEKPAKTKGYNPAKIVKVYTPKNDDGTFKMDEEFLEQQKAEAEAASNDGFN